MEQLQYRLVDLQDDCQFFPDASPLHELLGDFECQVASARLVARAMAHFPDEDAARAALRPYLVAWTSHVELTNGIQLEFQFDGSMVTDKTGLGVRRSITLYEAISLTDAAQVPRGAYPDFPQGWYGESPHVAQIRLRLRAVRTNRESLAAGAYWLLTKLEALHGNRQEAAAAMVVDPRILQTLGRLTARNDPDAGRKAKGPTESYTPTERTWILRAMEVLALREAELGVEGRDQLRLITMASLPVSTAGNSLWRGLMPRG